LTLTEIGGAVYRIENGKIAEYWIQLDRQGMELQLQQNERSAAANKPNQPPFSEAVISPCSAEGVLTEKSVLVVPVDVAANDGYASGR